MTEQTTSITRQGSSWPTKHTSICTLAGRTVQLSCSGHMQMACFGAVTGTTVLALVTTFALVRGGIRNTTSAIHPILIPLTVVDAAILVQLAWGVVWICVLVHVAAFCGAGLAAAGTEPKKSSSLSCCWTLWSKALRQLIPIVADNGGGGGGGGNFHYYYHKGNYLHGNNKNKNTSTSTWIIHQFMAAALFWRCSWPLDIIPQPQLLLSVLLSFHSDGTATTTTSVPSAIVGGGGAALTHALQFPIFLLLPVCILGRKPVVWNALSEVLAILKFRPIYLLRACLALYVFKVIMVMPLVTLLLLLEQQQQHQVEFGGTDADDYSFWFGWFLSSLLQSWQWLLTDTNGKLLLVFVNMSLAMVPQVVFTTFLYLDIRMIMEDEADHQGHGTKCLARICGENDSSSSSSVVDRILREWNKPEDEQYSACSVSMGYASLTNV